MSSKLSVGLLVMTRVNQRLVAILQRRGFYNHETRKLETWAHSFQPTSHGGLTPDDKIDTAVVLREAGEELGEKAGLALATSIANGNPLVKLTESQGVDCHVVTYGIIMPHKFIGLIRLSPSTGGIRLVTNKETQSIAILRPQHKFKGVSDSRRIFMFLHNRNAVLEAFRHFR